MLWELDYLKYFKYLWSVERSFSFLGKFNILDAIENKYRKCSNYSSHGVSWAEPGNCIIDKAQCIEFDF